MQKIATGLILAGFAFTFFAIPFLGIDLLMDPVGFVFVFNGARALARLAQTAAKPGGGKTPFPPAWVLALCLLVLSLPQVFLAKSPAAPFLGAGRAVLEAALYLLLAAGFYRSFALGAKRLPKSLAALAAGAFGLLAAATLAALLPLFFAAALLHTCQALALAALLALLICPAPAQGTPTK